MTILGYGLLTSDAQTLVDTLYRQNFKVVVIDESHYMKSRNATRSKILLPIVQKALRAVLLTGTPALGRPEEVFDMFCFGLVLRTVSVINEQFCRIYSFSCIMTRCTSCLKKDKCKKLN